MENTFEEDYSTVKPLELGKYQFYINIDGRVLGDFQPKLKFWRVTDLNNVFDIREEAERARDAGYNLLKRMKGNK